MPIKLEDAFSNLSMSYVTNIFGIRFYIQTRKTNQNRSQSKLTHQKQNSVTFCLPKSKS